MGKIALVQNAQDTSGVLPLGPRQQLAAFTIGGFSVDSVTLTVENLAFQVSKSVQVEVTNWQLGVPDTNDRIGCSFNSGDSVVSCLSISDQFGTLSGGMRTFRLFGDVTLVSGATNKNMQISLNLAGDTETNGAVQWTDGSGHFNWVELEQPLARSTLWK